MCSSSMASTTAPWALACSASRMRAACINAAVAACSDSSRWRAIWPRIATNSPPPSTTRISVKTPAYSSVSRRRTWASWLGRRTSGPEPVARAAQRGDQLGLMAVVDLLAQAAHQHFEHVGEGVVIVVPHVARDRGTIQHLALVQHEQLQQRELLGGQRDGPAAAAHLSRGEIDL